MLKMFTTQLQGLLNRIQDREGMAMEDGARLLAQAAVGEGKIYMIGIQEMKAVETEALHGAEPLKGLYPFEGAEQIDHFTDADRVLLISRFSHDQEALTIAKALADRGVPFVSIATEADSNDESIANLADVHIDLKLTKGLLPREDGQRFGFPSSMAALYVYFGLKFTLEEILEEYE
ncbi:DUF2529 domain-containing protein [Cytobacillus sp. Hz8]|uniref:DUF2529 domain-containing protein n=1 Tax=Cytobacillus sp. Hz8 TaxID=3347168 RepID=UPI0035DCBA4C